MVLMVQLQNTPLFYAYLGESFFFFFFLHHIQIAWVLDCRCLKSKDDIYLVALHLNTASRT